MNWTPPSCEEIKMDAEIGSYQPDGKRDSDPVRSVATAAVGVAAAVADAAIEGDASETGV